MICRQLITIGVLTWLSLMAVPVRGDELGDLKQLKDIEEKIEDSLDVRAAHEAKTVDKKLNANDPSTPGTTDIVEKMEELHGSLSDDIVDMADNIDSFFVNRQIIEGRNRTNARISNSFSLLENTGYKNDFDFKFRLQLPHLKEKVQVEFEDDFYDASDDDVRNSRVFSNRPNAGSRGGVAYYEKYKGIDSKLSTGIEYDHGVIVYGRFRLSTDIVLTPSQKITIIHDYFNDTRERSGQTGIINYDYSFNKLVLLRFLNEETYKDEFNTFETSHGFTLFQQISDRNFMAYNYRVNSVNPGGRETFYLNNHLATVVFRRRVYKKHFFYEVGPGVIFPKEQAFEGLLSFTLKLEVIFGNI